MNETIKNMIERRSIRKYTSEPVPQEIIVKIVELEHMPQQAEMLNLPIIIEVLTRN